MVVEGVLYKLCIPFVDLFNTTVINNFMLLPKIWCMWNIEISVFGELFLEQLDGQNSGLRESVHISSDFHAHKFFGFALKVILINEV